MPTTAELNDAAWSKYPYTYRNNRGSWKDGKRYVTYGIPEPIRGRKENEDDLKGGDRIGFSEVEITPDMVGKKIAVFTNIEIKGQGDKLVNGQKLWHNFVLEHGGISEIWDNGRIMNSEVDVDDA